MLTLFFIGCFGKSTDIPTPQKQQVKEVLVTDPGQFEQGVDLNNDGIMDTETTLEAGMKVQKIDINGDGQVDVVNHYKEREDGTQVLMYKSVDMNWDGKTDVQTSSIGPHLCNSPQNFRERRGQKNQKIRA